MEEIFHPVEEWNPKGKIQVRTLFTRVNGRCYLVSPDPDVLYRESVALTLKNMSTLKFFYSGREKGKTIIGFNM